MVSFSGAAGGVWRRRPGEATDIQAIIWACGAETNGVVRLSEHITKCPLSRTPQVRPCRLADRHPGDQRLAKGHLALRSLLRDWRVLPSARSGEEDVALLGYGALCHQEGGGVPGLAGHAAGGGFRAVKPFGEGPVAHGAGAREFRQLETRLRQAAAGRECGHPE